MIHVIINNFMPTMTKSTPQLLKVRNNAIHGAYIFINIFVSFPFCVPELLVSFILNKNDKLNKGKVHKFDLKDIIQNKSQCLN